MKRLFKLVLLLVSIYYSSSFYARCPKNGWSSRSSENFRLNDQNTLKTTVQPVDAKLRLDTYLSNRYKSYSRSFFGNLCEKGEVLVNNKPQDKGYKVHGGDVILANIIETRSTNSIEPENIPLDILYEDDHILAINKPNGMVVHPAVGSPNGTFVNALLHHLGDKASELLIDPNNGTKIDFVDDEEEDDEDDEVVSNATGRSSVDLPETPEAAKASPIFLRPGIVHRLDKGTTGVLLAGKHPIAVEKLSKVFAARKVTKIYLAVCVGHPGDTTIAEPIGRSKVNRQIMCVTDGLTGRDAITHTKTIAFDGKISVVLIRIETGRTHQIRVHLKDRRTPILGDEVYGNHDWNKQYYKLHKAQRPLLHAYETRFLHPITQKPVKLIAPLPPDIAEVVDAISKKLVTPATTELQRGSFFDVSKRVLLCDTKVDGRAFTKSPGGTPINSERVYVPSDRLKLEEKGENDWMLDTLIEVEDR